MSPGSHESSESPENRTPDQAPIGVFDSGIGGLTVVKALREHLPRESVFYLGDTARLPYGNKDQFTIERYSLEIGGLLAAEGAKMIVVACNTASALALPKMQEVFRIPIVGVIAPGARAAVKYTRNGRIGVTGTRATVASGAYQRSIAGLRGDAAVFSQACPLLVPLIEEAMFDHEVTWRMVRDYLTPLLAQEVDTIVLGCTHYPLLRDLIQKVVGETVCLVDSAENCALAVAQLLAELRMLSDRSTPGYLSVALTDSSNPFLATAQAALGLKIDRKETRLVQSFASIGRI